MQEPIAAAERRVPARGLGEIRVPHGELFLGDPGVCGDRCAEPLGPAALLPRRPSGADHVVPGREGLSDDVPAQEARDAGDRNPERGFGGCWEARGRTIVGRRCLEHGAVFPRPGHPPLREVASAPRLDS